MTLARTHRNGFKVEKMLESVRKEFETEKKRLRRLSSSKKSYGRYAYQS